MFFSLFDNLILFKSLSIAFFLSFDKRRKEPGKEECFWGRRGVLFACDVSYLNSRYSIIARYFTTSANLEQIVFVGKCQKVCLYEEE